MKTKKSSLAKFLTAAIALVVSAISHSAQAQSTISYASPAAYTEATVASTASSANITVTDGTKYVVGDFIRFTGTSATTNPFGTAAANYYVTSVSGNTITVSTTPGGSALTAVNTTTVTTTSLGQNLLVGSNWTGGTAPDNNSTIANFGNTASGVFGYVVNGNQTIYGLTFNGGGSSDLTLVSGGNGTSLNTLTLATNDSTTPKFTLNGSTRLIALGSGNATSGNMKLALAGNQGVIFNSVAGGALTGSGVAATSTNAAKDTRIQNVDWTNLSGGVTVERGEVRLNAATGVLPNQTLTVGNNQTVTNARLAGLNIQGFGSTVDALNGNSLGRIWGASTLTIGNAGGSGDFGGVIGSDFAGATTATGITKAGSGNQTLSGRIAGSGNIIVNAGKLVISGNNTSTGTTTINGGTLEVSGGAAISDTGAVTLANAAGVTFRLSSNETIGSLAGGNSTVGTVDLQSNALTVGGSNNSTTVGALISGSGGSIIKTGNGSLTLSNSNTFDGGFVLKQGTVNASVANSVGANSNAVTLGDNVVGADATLNVTTGATLNQSISIASGAGNRTLQSSGGASNMQFAGGVSLSNNLSLNVSSNSQVMRFLTGAITGNGNINVVSTGNAGVSFRSALNQTGNITNSSTGTSGTGVSFDTTSNTIGANIGSLIQNSANTTMSIAVSQNNFVGTVQVLNGTFLVSNAAGLNSNNAVSVGSSGTFDVRASHTIGGLNNVSGSGGIVTNGSNSTNTVLTVGGASGNFSFGGAIADGATNKLGLTKSGNSIQTLTGTNTYTGNTTVTAGTLVLSGTGSIANSPLIRVQSGAAMDVSAVTGGFQLASGQTLQNKGTITGSVTALSGSTYAPGNSPGLATQAGNLALNTGSVFQWELVANTTSGAGTNYDQTLFTSGGLTIQSGVTADLVFNYAGSTVDWANTFWDINQSWTLFTGASSLSSVAGVFGTVNVGLDSLGNSLSVARGSFSFTTSGNDVLLAYTAVPEPGTWALLALGMTAAVVFRRRKQS